MAYIVVSDLVVTDGGDDWRIHPRTSAGSYFTISKTACPSETNARMLVPDIVRHVNAAYSAGIRKGKEELQEEIRSVLGL